MKKKGFTLIELLAVIIILAIIALIATPIIMRIIENSKKSAAERSASNYIKEVETLIIAERLNGNIIEDGIYTLDNNGDICLNNECNKTLVVTMTGTKPSSGKVKIENEKVTAHILTIGDYEEKYGSFPRLPDEYQEVEYIESTGGQYINTEVSGNNLNLAFSGKFNANSIQPYTYPRIFGSQMSGSMVTLGARWWFGMVASSSRTDLLNIFTDTDFIFECNKTGINLNNSFYPINLVETNPLQNLPNIYLFKGTASSDFGAVKIYYFSIRDNGTLIRDFIPCYRKSDNKPGMYDLVNNIFYTNQGDGEFEIGDEV